MKVLMQGRIELKKEGGGDKVQILNTAKCLRELGVDVDLDYGSNIDYSKYDLVHMFQLDWTPEPALYTSRVKAAGKPLVFSPIHHNLAEVMRFDNVYTFDFRRVAKFLFSNQFKRDTFKNIYKSLFNPSKLKPTVLSVILGLKSIQKHALEDTDVVLVQTHLEAVDLKNTYAVDFDYKKIPNGVSADFLNFRKTMAPPSDVDTLLKKIGADNYIICVGRIEARKNQLSVIEAVKRLRFETGQDIKLVFVGRMSKLKHYEYTLRFDYQLQKNPWIVYLSEVPYEFMPYLYAHAKVGVSASWFETTGLTSLEALFCGTNSVASGERAREYLGDYASYCDPAEVSSIYQALKHEYFAQRPVLADNVFSNFTWAAAAKMTLDVYKSLVTTTLQ